MVNFIQALFFHQGYSDDTLYRAWKEDGVCWGDDISEHGWYGLNGLHAQNAHKIKTERKKVAISC